MFSLFPSRAIAFEVFGFGVHWYGIMYLLAFVLTLVLLPSLQRYRTLTLTREEWAEILSGGVLGVIIGGRLGYVLFYEPVHFAHHPEEIIAVWQGGMSFHGGLVGVAVVLLFFCWKKKLSLLRIADTIVIPAALGLALGRFGNFINQELYGTVTTLPWGIAVPGVEGLRHPAQLYSMCLDLCNAALCYMHLRWVRVRKPGQTTALFLVLYGIARFAVEFVREQQYPLVDLFGFSLTRGQLLTIPVFLFGILLWMFVVMPEEE